MKNDGGQAPFDPEARFVDKKTGYEYEDFASFFAGQTPLRTQRNLFIEGLRDRVYPEHAIKTYWENYDWAAGDHAAKHDWGVQCGRNTGCWGPKSYAGAARHLGAAIDRTRFAILAPAHNLFDPDDATG